LIVIVVIFPVAQVSHQKTSNLLERRMKKSFGKVVLSGEEGLKILK
jgi:hypothetical protein